MRSVVSNTKSLLGSVGNKLSSKGFTENNYYDTALRALNTYCWQPLPPCTREWSKFPSRRLGNLGSEHKCYSE